MIAEVPLHDDVIDAPTYRILHSLQKINSKRPPGNWSGTVDNEIMEIRVRSLQASSQ